MWSPCEGAKSSAWRELKAIHFALTSFKTLVQGKSVKWHSDNQGAARIVDVGRPHPELHSIALDIFNFCRTNNVILVPQWVPRELNVSADEISKIVDYDDWYTTLEFFKYLGSFWGPRTVGWFANASNTHLRRFNSRFSVLGSEAVDAFSVSWTGENNWLVPPVDCIIRVVQHLVCTSVGILVVPYWPSNAFWPFLFTSLVEYQPCVIESISFPDP